VKRSLFTTPVAAQSKNLGDTSVVAKSRFSVAKTPTATNKVIQLILWIVDSGFSKHITGNLQPLRNFVEKFMGTARFGNDHFTAITGYGDYVQGNLMICRVYYVEGLGHNLFSVGQFCDGDLEVAFHLNTCYVQNLEGDDLLTGSRESNLYTISISKLAASSPACLMSKATSIKSWLWHRGFSYLNFGTINQLTSKDLVNGLPKFMYDKDHLCSTCDQGKSKKTSFPSILVPRTESKIELIHMDLYGPMRVESINGKKYILNRFLVHTRYKQDSFMTKSRTKPNVQYFHMFGSLCYLKNDRDDLRKMKSKSDIGIFIGYAESSRGFRIYNRRTKKIMETTHVKFDELTAMASEYNNSRPDLNYSKFQDSSEELNEILSQQVLYKLFGPLDAPQMVTSSEESIIQESSIPILETHSDEQIQEDVAKLTGILSCILLKFLSSKKLSHLQTIRTRQTCTSSINNIAH
ncbi:retrovirus-related pol polyprotein from transposon TNT 1-94, partial [Tanacetum coccineum]